MLLVDLLVLGVIVVGLGLGVTQVAAPLARGEELFPLFRRPPAKRLGASGTEELDERDGSGRRPKTMKTVVKKVKK